MAMSWFPSQTCPMQQFSYTMFGCCSLSSSCQFCANGYNNELVTQGKCSVPQPSNDPQCTSLSAIGSDTWYPDQNHYCTIQTANMASAQCAGIFSTVTCADEVTTYSAMLEFNTNPGLTCSQASIMLSSMGCCADTTSATTTVSTATAAGSTPAKSVETTTTSLAPKIEGSLTFMATTFHDATCSKNEVASDEWEFTLNQCSQPDKEEATYYIITCIKPGKLEALAYSDSRCTIRQAEDDVIYVNNVCTELTAEGSVTNSIKIHWTGACKGEGNSAGVTSIVFAILTAILAF